MLILFVFLFKQKTAYEMRISDWSSDVCSSDLPTGDEAISHHRRRVRSIASFCDDVRYLMPPCAIALLRDDRRHPAKLFGPFQSRDALDVESTIRREECGPALSIGMIDPMAILGKQIDDVLTILNTQFLSGN